MDKGKLKGHAALWVANIVWGLNAPIGKSVLQSEANPGGISPFALSVYRMVGAALLFWAVSLFFPRERVAPRDIVLLLFAFVPQFGAEGVWVSVFTAISAFCNAGFDLFGRFGDYSSLVPYVNNYYVQAVIMFMIMAGGLGFMVWVELAEYRKKRRLSLHAKVVLQFSVIFWVGGAVLLALIAWSDSHAAGICFGDAKQQSFTLAGPHVANVLSFEHPVAPLTVGTIDAFIEYFMARHIEARVDYVHDEPAVRALCKQQGGVAFLLPPFEKSDLFKGIVMGGVLPRKTFSMGHAEEKRYYIECRKIIE